VACSFCDDALGTQTRLNFEMLQSVLGISSILILLSPTSFAVGMLPERQHQPPQYDFGVKGNYRSRMCDPSNKIEVASTATLAKKITHAGHQSELIVLRDIKGTAKSSSPLPPRTPHILLYLTTACSKCHMKYLEGCWPKSMESAPLLSRADVLLFAGCR
jgi:hypothetical protein